MRRGLLSPACYWSTDVFLKERERLFGALWVFAGLKQALATADSFITREIAGRQVVLQNFDGALRAFENVCLHRGKLIQPAAAGCRPLVCGYHGWRYGADGAVTMIPFEDDCYRFAPCDRASLRLREFAVRVLGSLVFVNIAERPRPIEEQFAPAFIAQLESASGAFDNEFLVTKWRKRFNWKLAYENLRDVVHPRFVHTKSLSLHAVFPLDAPKVDDVNEGTEIADPSLQDLSYGGAEGSLKRSHPPLFSEWVDRWGETDAYFNWLMYPNTHMLTSDGGYSFSVEHHHPVSPEMTEITAYFLTARKRRRVAWLAPTLWEMAKGAKRILDEDTDVMEDVQRALAPQSGHVVHGVYEMQNRRTDLWYERRVLADRGSVGDE